MKTKTFFRTGSFAVFGISLLGLLSLDAATVQFNGVKVKVTERGELLTAQAGQTYTKPSYRLETFFRDAVQGGGRVVAVGGSCLGERGVIVYSTDGRNFKRSYLPVRVNFYGVAYGHGLYVSVGEEGTIATSPDAETWTVRSCTPGALLTSVAYGDGEFVAVGDSGRVLTSRDGLEWNTETVDSSLYLSKVAHTGGKFVVKSNTGLFERPPGGWKTIDIAAVED